jgi:cytochrome P450
VNKAFTARRAERLKPRITAITAGLLDDMSTRREVDLFASFAFPLPITVICELLGVPVADQDDFRTWSATIVSNTASPGVFQAHATAMIPLFHRAWARRWPGWRLRSRSADCWRGSARCGWRCPRARRAGGRAH